MWEEEQEGEHVRECECFVDIDTHCWLNFVYSKRSYHQSVKRGVDHSLWCKIVGKFRNMAGKLGRESRSWSRCRSRNWGMVLLQQGTQNC